MCKAVSNGDLLELHILKDKAMPDPASDEMWEQLVSKAESNKDKLLQANN